MLGPAFTLLIGAAAAASYDLNLDVTLGTHAPTKAQVRVATGRPVTLTRDVGGERLFVEVAAEDSAKDATNGVLLRFVVGTLSRTSQRQVVARPQIRVIDGERSMVAENQVSVVVTSRRR